MLCLANMIPSTINTSNARPRARSALSRRNIVFELSANNLSIQSQTATLPLVHFLQKSKKIFFIKKGKTVDTQKSNLGFGFSMLNCIWPICIKK